jgi:hypothetical protein
MTDSHGFCVDVFHDAELGAFVAKLQTHSPPVMPVYIPGPPIEPMDFDDLVELRHRDLDGLRELVKQRIIAECGQIVEFNEEEAQQHLSP